MRKYLSVALALLALGAAGTAPASARVIHHHRHGLFMYAPGGAGTYPNPIGRTGTAVNRRETRD